MTESVVEEESYMDEDVIVMDDILEVDDISMFEESADPGSIPLQSAGAVGETTDVDKEENTNKDGNEEDENKAQLVDVIEIHDDESFDVLFDDTQNDLDSDLMSKNTSAEKEDGDLKAEDIPITEKKSEKKSEAEDNKIEGENKSVDEKKKTFKSDGKSLNTKSSAATVKDKENKKDDKGREGTNCNLWVSGISSSTRANDLKSLFNKHVKVVGAKIMTNARAPGSQCYGYIILSSPEDATKCIKQLHNTDFHGKSIQVSYERPNNDVSGQSKVKTSDQVNKSHGKEKKMQDKKSVDINKDKSTSGKKEVKKDSKKVEDSKKDKKKTDDVKSGNSTTVKSKNNKVPQKDSKKDSKASVGNDNIVKGKSVNTGKEKSTTLEKQRTSAPRRESNSATVKRKNSGNDEKKNIVMKSKSESDISSKNSKTVKQDLNKTDVKKPVKKLMTDDKSKYQSKSTLKVKILAAQKSRKSSSSGSTRESNKIAIGRRNMGYQKDRSTSVHSKSSDKSRSKAADDKWEIEEKSKRLKVVHIQQKEEARKLQEERAEIRRVKKELEWRKYESYKQEQLWREQMERENKEREWEEKRILDEIRIEEEERMRYEEEQRRLAYEEEQRRIAEQERLEEEERIRHQEKQRYEEEQRRLMNDQWRTLEADHHKSRHHEQHRDHRSSGANRHSHEQHNDRRNNQDHWERREREKAQWKEREMQKEKQRKEQERLERERKEKERLERERLEREKLERERRERERLEREIKEKEQKERERLEKERQERERLEREKAQKEREKQELAERIKELEKEKEERIRREKKLLEELRQEKEQLKKEAMKRSYESRQIRDDYPPPAKRLGLSDDRYHSRTHVSDNDQLEALKREVARLEGKQRRSLSPRRSNIDRNDHWDRDISRRDDRNPRDDHRGDDNYHSVHNERDRGYHHDDRHSHGYSHGDYDERNRRQNYDDRGRNVDRKEHHSSSKDWDRREVGYRDSIDERGYELDEGPERTVTLYKKSKEDRDHPNSRNRDIGYSRGQDQNPGYDRGRNEDYKGRKDDYHTRIREENIKREADIDRNRNFDKKSVQKSRANDDLWRNAGYGKSNINDRMNQNMNFHGNTGAQTNWSNTSRDKTSSSGQNAVRSGNNFQQNQHAARIEKRGPVWGTGSNFPLSSNQFQHNSHSSSSAPVSDNRHSSQASFPADTRLNPSLVNENLLSAQQTNIFGNARLNTPAIPSSVHTMPLVHHAVGSASQPIIQHPQQSLVNQPPVGMMPRPGVPGAGQQSFLNVGFKYYTPGRF